MRRPAWCRRGPTPRPRRRRHGLTAAPLTYLPRRGSAAEARDADPATLRVPALTGLPIAVVTGGASIFASFADDVVASLAVAGADVERLHLSDHGVTGNGHALIYESNSDETLAVVLRWITVQVSQHEVTR